MSWQDSAPWQHERTDVLTKTDPAGVDNTTHATPTDGPRVSEFGDRLRKLRKARGLSGPELAKLASYSRGYIWELSMGRKPPTTYVASHLDRMLRANGELVALAVGGTADDAIGFVCTGDTWLRVRAVKGSPLVTLNLDALVGETAALARVRDVVFAGQARAQIDLARTQVVEVVRLLQKAATVAYGKQCP